MTSSLKWTSRSVNAAAADLVVCFSGLIAIILELVSLNKNSESEDSDLDAEELLETKLNSVIVGLYWAGWVALVLMVIFQAVLSGNLIWTLSKGEQAKILKTARIWRICNIFLIPLTLSLRIFVSNQIWFSLTEMILRTIVFLIVDKCVRESDGEQALSMVGYLMKT